MIFYKNYTVFFNNFLEMNILSSKLKLIINKNSCFSNYSINAILINYLLKHVLSSLFFKINKKLLFIFCGFSYSKIFLKVGLGFRKKYSKSTSIYSLSVGRRRWIIFNMQPSSFFFNIRRRSIYMFCNSKKKLYKNINCLRKMRKETVFKVKGIMTLNRIIFNKRIGRSIVFARRVKFRKLRLKLNKKQKQRK